MQDLVDLQGFARSSGGTASAYMEKRCIDPRNLVSMLIHSRELSHISSPIRAEGSSGRVPLATGWPSRKTAILPVSFRSNMIASSLGSVSDSVRLPEWSVSLRLGNIGGVYKPVVRCPFRIIDLRILVFSQESAQPLESQQRRVGRRIFYEAEYDLPSIIDPNLE